MFCNKIKPLALITLVFITSCLLETESGDSDDVDAPIDDDVNSDNDTTDDDSADDDVIDDDTGSDHAPILTDVRFDPDPVELGSFPEFGAGLWWYSYLVFSICDQENDLLPEGMLIAFHCGETGNDCFFFSELNDPPQQDLSDVDNCGQPVFVRVLSVFGPEEAAPFDPDIYCMYVEASDTAGNLSERIDDVCLSLATP